MLSDQTPESAVPFDLSCWYINQQRIFQMLGTDQTAAIEQHLAESGRVAGPLASIRTNVALKDILVSWLKRDRITSLEKQLFEGTLEVGKPVTIYQAFYHRTVRGSKETPPLRESYFIYKEPFNIAVRCRYSPTHYTSASSSETLSGMRRVMIVGHVSDIQPIEVIVTPLAIADVIPEKELLFGYMPALQEYGEVFIDGIDTFDEVRNEPRPVKSELTLLKEVTERQLKEAIASILGEEIIPTDWGGESSDLFTSHLSINETRMTAAFLLKGPAKFHPMRVPDLGKNGDQINRLATEPVSVLVVQHCHEVKPEVRTILRAFANQLYNLRRYCVIDGYDTIRLLRAYQKCGFVRSKKTANQ